MSTELHTTVAGEHVTIRPIRLTDAAMEAEFISRLSERTRHYRFLGGVKELSPTELRHLCDIDQRHSMAFVATVQREGREREIGVSRYAPGSTADAREIAVTVADEWQHKGLGTVLMKALIESARSNGVRQLYSIDEADNAEMRQLARDLGMSGHGDPDDPSLMVYSLPL